MHITNVVKKDGTKLSGILWTVRPVEGWFELVACTDNDEPVRVQIVDCQSVVTEKDRISINKIGDVDELERWRKHVEDAKKYGWGQ